MPRRADDQRFLFFGAQRYDARRGSVRTEIHHDVRLADARAQIVALINLAGDFEFAKVRRTGDKRPAHAAFRTGDDDFGHDVMGGFS